MSIQENIIIEARLNAIQVDPGTYCDEPTGSAEAYEDWLKTFNLEKQKGDISELLVVNVEVRALYTQLVCTHSLANSVFLYENKYF
jgi:hypothetical protein